MPAVLLDGDLLATRLRTDLAIEVARLASRGRTPLLATITVGDNPATLAYMGRKHADCAAVGIASRDLRFPSDVTDTTLRDCIAQLNDEAAVTALSLQIPLPAHLDAASLVLATDPAKDADAKHPLTLGRLAWRLPAHRPCTAAGVLALLAEQHVPLAGRRILLVGRGFFTGLPLMTMLSAPGVDGVVTIAHRRAQDLGALTRESDVVISAAGQPDLITASMVKPGAAVLGVGISYVDGSMVSDIADDVAGVAGFVTPRHGSIGALTRAMLLRNVVDIARGRE
jgi:methylenetetrahydrofolate dehydrogenase (NADP+) / methenyltetrahydrofolate cyclohydrolase